jgi:hypothetical protein
MSRGRWLAARLGLDGNSLRRRADRIAAIATVGLLVAFLVAAPIAAVFAGHWAYRSSMSQQRDQRSWRAVTAVLLQKAPVDPGSLDVSGSPAVARWTPPGGHHAREGVISVPAGTPAGSRVRIWLDASGQWAGPPLGRQAVVVRVVMAVVGTTLVLATGLAAIASVGQWLLDRRRLAGWEADWNEVGPQWAKEFRARGESRRPRSGPQLPRQQLRMGAHVEQPAAGGLEPVQRHAQEPPSISRPSSGSWSHSAGWPGR